MASFCLLPKQRKERTRKEKNVSIGGIGLTGMPNEQGEVTVGYAMDSIFRNQGFATETVQAMVSWIFDNPEAMSILAETKNNNFASQKVLLKNGFQQAGQYEDYLQWRLTRPLT